MKKKKKKNIGRKDDKGKPPVTQFLRQFPKAIKYLAKLSEYGHNTYGAEEDNDAWDNWKKVENAKFRYEQAGGRHALEEEGPIDESGFKHVAHAAWNFIAVLELELEDEEQISI